MQTEERQNEIEEQQALAEAKRVAQKKSKDLVKKVILKIAQAAVASLPVILMLVKVIAIILLVTSVIALFTITIDGSGSKSADEEGLYGANSELAQYLLQFSHSGEAPQSDDGKYYKMYSDGKWPTIGNADLLWQAHESKFECSGQVFDGTNELDVENVREYVNSFLTKPLGSQDEYSVEEIDAMNIYIEKSVVDGVGAQVCGTTYEYVEDIVKDLALSKQQKYALTAISYNYGSLPVKNGYTFVEIYEEGAAMYGVNSWEQNMYIWDNWWCYLVMADMPGFYGARDACFETYVKGVYDFSESDAGEVFSRNYYIYWTQEQLERPEYAPYPAKEVTRTPANESEIFEYNEVN